MSSMFYGASALTNLNLSNFNTSSVNSMAYMFYGTAALTSLTTTGWTINSTALNSTNVFSTSPNLVVTCNQPGTPGSFFGKTCH